MSENLIIEENATSETFLLDNYKGIVFDCDGTLVNSMDYYFNGWKPLYEKRGLDFPRDRFYALAGVPVRQIIQIILEENKVGFDDDLVNDILEEKKSINTDRRARGEAPTEITCVSRITKQLHGKIPMAVASSGQKFLVEEDLRNHNLIDLFDAVVTIEDVKNGKPEPDIYIEACRRINIDPKQCIGFEDAVLGISSLHAANMDAVDVTKFEGYPN